MALMAAPSDKADDKDLHQFLKWVTPLAFGFAALFAALCVGGGGAWLAVIAFAAFGAGCLLLLAHSWASRGFITRAGALVCLTLLAVDLLASATEPIESEALVILPLLAAALAVRYTDGRVLRRLLGLCWLAVLCAAIIDELLDAHTIVPFLLFSSLRVALLMAAVSVALLLLWQFSSRLSGTLIEMRSANAALSESEMRYRLISELTVDNIYAVRIDASGEPVLEWVSDPSAMTVGGYALTDVLRHSDWRSIIYPEDQAIEAAHGEAVMAGESHVVEYRICAKNGELRWLRDHARPEWDAAHDRVVRIFAAMTDVTDRRRAEEGLRESRLLLQLVADVVPMLIAYVDAQQRYRFVNRAYAAWFGLSEQAIIGRTMREIVGDEQFVQIADAVAAALGGQQVAFERVQHGHNAAIQYLRVLYIPDTTQGAPPPGFVIMVEDITERRRAEEQRLAFERKMLETQKNESISVLAGGIAHDFNNLLTSILGNAGVALLELPPESSARATLGQIERVALQAAELTKQMLAYSGKGHFLIRPLNLNTVIADSRILITASLGKAVRLRYGLAQSLPVVEGDAAQLTQALMSLVMNAAESFEGHPGEVELQTAAIPGSQLAFDQLDLVPDHRAAEYVVLRVVDTGCGMDAQTRARMFDPFFSTKFTGRGLGLAAVLGIVRGHHGGLQVQSQPGHGTSVTILLPGLPAEPVMAESPLQSPLAALETATTVLVIDDDPAVRTVAVRMLQRMGCVVLQAADGHAALDILQSYQDEIHLALLDLMLPDVSGAQVFSLLQRQRPGLRVVLMSGYTEDDVAGRFGEAVPAGFLQKPFSPDELRDILRRAHGVAES